MKAVQVVTGQAVPLDRSDVDTDQIIPSDWLKQVERTGFEKGLFSEWRDDPNFVMNDERFAGAKIIIGGPNFGVGSSREHAVWAIQQSGFEAVISPRFGDIFRNNSTKNGLIPVVVSEELGRRLLDEVEKEPTLEFTIDVERALLEVPAIGISEPFPIDAATKERFLKGLDDIGLSLKHASAIDAFEADRPQWMPATS